MNALERMTSPIIPIELYQGELNVTVNAWNHYGILASGQLLANPELGYYVQNGEKVLLEIKFVQEL